MPENIDSRFADGIGKASAAKLFENLREEPLGRMGERALERRRGNGTSGGSASRED